MNTQKDMMDPGPSTSPIQQTTKKQKTTKTTDNTKNTKKSENNNHTGNDRQSIHQRPVRTSRSTLTDYAHHHIQTIRSLPPTAISIASLNVNGMVDTNKQLHLLTTLQQRHYTFIGIQDTRLTTSQSTHNFKYNKDYDFWHSPRSSSNICTGVGILIHKDYSKYVQKVYKINPRVIFVDLYFPGKKKLRIFSLYALQKLNRHLNDRSIFFNTVIQHYNYAHQHNFHTILIGDFNASPEDLVISYQRRKNVPHHLRLLHYFDQHNLIDMHPKIDGKKIATYYSSSHNTKSRIDQIWISPMLFDDCLYTDVQESQPLINTDHKFIVLYLDGIYLTTDVSPAHLKQQKSQRTFYLFDEMDDNDWTHYGESCDQWLTEVEEAHPAPHRPAHPQQRINRKWDILNHTIVCAAQDTIPTKSYRDKLSNSSRSTFEHSTSFCTLKRFNAIASHFTLHHFRTNTHIQGTDWFHTYNELFHIQKKYGFIQDVVFPTSIDVYLQNTGITTNYNKCRNLIRMFNTYCLHLKKICETESHQWRLEQIQKYNEIRDMNYCTNLSTFLHSALDRQSRKIVLDRLLIPLGNNEFDFTTDPTEIKNAASKHFQNIVGQPTDIPLLNDRWLHRYAPVTHITGNIYSSLMLPPSDEECEDVLKTMPKNKAAGPSTITYEMLQNSGTETKKLLFDLIRDCCITSGTTPDQWRTALIFPIPKPHE